MSLAEAPPPLFLWLSLGLSGLVGCMPEPAPAGGDIGVVGGQPGTGGGSGDGSSDDTDTDPDGDTDGSTGDTDTDTDEPVGPTIVPVSRAPSVSGLPTVALPVQGAFVLDSGFGPRRLSSQGSRTDFHPGVDLDASMGTSVVSVGVGEVVSISSSSDGGNTVTVEHTLATPIDFHGETVRHWYARYLHLATVRVAEGDLLPGGARIGTVGDSGGVVESHLHFEVRVGTRCSLQYSVENPTSGCARSYDPAVNPLHVLDLADPELFTATVLGTEPLVIRVTSREGDFDLNRIEAGGRVLDYDLRIGIDARTESAIDDLDYGWLTIDPLPDSAEPDWQSWDFTFTGSPTQVDFYAIDGEGIRVVL